MIRRGLGDDRGSVAAEFAVALPAIMVVLMLGAGALGAGARHVRLQDAAADAARLVARGEPSARASATVTAGVSGAAVEVAHRGDLVCVSASAPAFGAVPVMLTATSCALAGGL